MMVDQRGSNGPNVIYHDPPFHGLGIVGDWVVEVDGRMVGRAASLSDAHDHMQYLVGNLDYTCENGECDACGFVYEAAADDHCGECGCCERHCLCGPPPDGDLWCVEFDAAYEYLIGAGWSKRNAVRAATAVADLAERAS